MYITHGPFITLHDSAGKGTPEFVLNGEGEYVIFEEDITVSDKDSIYSLGNGTHEYVLKELCFHIVMSIYDDAIIGHFKHNLHDKDNKHTNKDYKKAKKTSISLLNVKISCIKCICSI